MKIYTHKTIFLLFRFWGKIGPGHMFVIAFDNNLNKILLDSSLTVCLKNRRTLKNGLKTDPHFASLFGGSSGVEMTH